MAEGKRRGRVRPDKQAGTLQEWVEGAHLSFSQSDLVAALKEMTRNTTAVSLPARDRDFWEIYSGAAATDAEVAVASAASAAARIIFDSSAVPAAEVAERMHLSASTVRRYKAARKLYAYVVNGKLAFPDWQFNEAGSRSIPSLEEVLGVLRTDLHPQAVAGFFLTPQPDLVLRGRPVSAKA